MTRDYELRTTNSPEVPMYEVILKRFDHPDEVRT